MLESKLTLAGLKKVRPKP